MGLPGIIKGYVKNNQGLPLAGATVVVGQGVYTTLENGAYLACANPGSYTVSASKLGYITASVPVVLTAGKITSNDFVLQPA
jgi:hypothetical protein